MNIFMTKARKIVVDIVLIASYAMVVFAIVSSLAAEIKFDTALKMISIFRWTDAENIFRQAIKIDPLDSRYFAGFGKFILLKNSYLDNKLPLLDMAEKLYKLAAGLNPRNADYRFMLGRIRLERLLIITPSDKRTYEQIEQIMDDFKEASKNDPFGFNVSYQVGYAGISVLKLTGQEDREFIVDRLRFTLKIKPSYYIYIYPRLWSYAKDFNLLKAITSDNFNAQNNLYNFLVSNNLWQFWKEQAVIVSIYKQKERLEEFNKERDERSQAVKSLKQNLETERKLAEAGVLERIDGKWQAAEREGDALEYQKAFASRYKEGLVLPEDWEGKSFDEKYTSRDGNMYWPCTISSLIYLPKGKIALKIKARGTPASGMYPYMIVELDGEVIGETFLDSSEWKEYVFKTDTDGGIKVLSISYVNDTYINKNGKAEDRNLFIGEAGFDK